MTVLLPERALGVRTQAVVTDTHGHRLSGSWGALRGPWPGRAEQGADVAPLRGPGGRTWVLALDPRAWPVRPGDLVEDPGSGERWLVTSADLLTHNADPAIDYVRVEAHTHTASGTLP